MDQIFTERIHKHFNNPEFNRYEFRVSKVWVTSQEILGQKRMYFVEIKISDNITFQLQLDDKNKRMLIYWVQNAHSFHFSEIVKICRFLFSARTKEFVVSEWNAAVKRNYKEPLLVDGIVNI